MWEFSVRKGMSALWRMPLKLVVVCQVHPGLNAKTLSVAMFVSFNTPGMADDVAFMDKRGDSGDRMGIVSLACS